MKIELQAIENLDEVEKRVRLLLDAGAGDFAIVTVRVDCQSDSLQEIREAAISKLARLWPRAE